MDLNGLRNFNQTLVVRGIAQGAVTASKTVNVKFYGVTIKCRATRGVTTAAGDVVLALRSGFEMVVIERLHASAPTSDPSIYISEYPPNPWSSVQTGKSVFRPVETRSYMSTVGWRKDLDDTLQGPWRGHSHKGCAFYGKGPRSLLGSEVTSAYVQLKRPYGATWTPGAPVTIRRFPEATRPKVDDIVFEAGTLTGPNRLKEGQSVTFPITTSWGQEFADGVAGGLGIQGSLTDPQVHLAGRAEWSAAWTLILNWRRVI